MDWNPSLQLSPNLLLLQTSQHMLTIPIIAGNTVKRLAVRSSPHETRASAIVINCMTFFSSYAHLSLQVPLMSLKHRRRAEILFTIAPEIGEVKFARVIVFLLPCDPHKVYLCRISSLLSLLCHLTNLYWHNTLSVIESSLAVVCHRTHLDWSCLQLVL